MKSVQYDNTKERLVLTGMIVSTKVLAKIAPKWTKEEGLFRSKYANRVGGWCIRFFRKHQRAPGKNIVGLFASWSESALDKAEVKAVEGFLSDLSDDFKAIKHEINSSYTIDTATEHFNEVRASRLKADIEYFLETGNLDKALHKIKTFNKIEMGMGEIIDVFQNVDAIKEAFTQKRESLVIYPGDLQLFFGDALERDGFIAFMGAEKRGKTWWLIDVAYRASLQRRRVLFLEIGDLTKNQIERRLGTRAVRRPIKAKKIWLPKSIRLEGQQAEVHLVSRDFAKNLDWREVVRAYQKLMKEKIHSDKPYFKISCHPARTLSTDGIRNIIESLIADGWPPDLVVVDYADILAPADLRMDKLDQVNENWVALRRISQEFHCLVITATQIKASGYKAQTLSMEHFSENHLKFAHITGMIGINHSEEEKRRGIQRLNWTALREDEFLEGKHVHVGGCLAVANPAIVSVF